jgi:hypothetical protein
MLSSVVAKKSIPDRSDNREFNEKDLEQIAELRKENAELRDLLGQTVVLVQTVFVYLGTDPLSTHRARLNTQIVDRLRTLHKHLKIRASDSKSE